ncbi:hypothetical protein GGI12_001850 [Dipsacomyces acuminosporus]|nr:hypothetical protein GGI12_001850 [Dipsacomyces acuminosporus]
MASPNENASAAVVDGVEEITEWVSNDGREFYTHLYKAATQPPAATLVIVHGLGEHADRYDSMARSFARGGIQVLGFDQRGFGKTGRRSGTLGDNEGISTVAKDIGFMTRHVGIDGVPHFLYGHSMGGLNVINYCMEHNGDDHVKGAVVSAPALIGGKELVLPSFIEPVGLRVAQYIPNVQRGTGITADMLTNNQAELDRYNASTDIIGHATLGTLSGIVLTGKDLVKRASEFRTPIYLAHADGDRATDCRGTRQFFKGLSDALDKEYNEIRDHQFHEIHFQEDLGFDLVDTFKQWILKRADTAA